MNARQNEKRRALWICLGLTLVWIAFIFLRSMQSGEKSAEESSVIWTFLSKFIPSLSHTLVRKLGHLAEFTVLGCLLAALFRARGFPAQLQKLSDLQCHIVLPAYCGLVVAFCDEIIQTGVPGRDGKITDVLIDFAGVCLGLLAVTVWTKRRKGEFGGSQ